MTWARPATPPQDPTEFSQARAYAKSQEAIQQALAVRTVASHAADAGECRRLLAMLGLDPEEGRRAGVKESQGA
jgi:hypothetical protein